LRALRGDLDNIVLKALQKEPAERYASPAAFSEDLLRYLEGRPVLARGEGFGYVATKLVRRHKLAAIATGIVMCAAVAGFIAVTRAQHLAERRFNEVRELAHAVIFDYHDAIEQLPGSTPVQERLVKDAVKYLDSLSKEADTPELRRELVDAYVRLSSVQGDSYHNNLGESSGAMTTARKAVTSAGMLLATDRSPASLRSAASAYAVEGSLFYSAGDLTSASRLLRQAADSDEIALRAQPNDMETAIALASGLRKLGDLYGGNGMQNLGKTEESIRSYERAKSIAEQLVQRFPTDLRARKLQYATLLSLGSIQVKLGKFTEASEYLRAAVKSMQETCNQDPNDATAQMQLANASVQLGQLLVAARRGPEAAPYISRSADIMQHLADTDPRNALYRRSLAIVETQYAAALRVSGDLKGALEHNLKALHLAEALNQAAPQNVEYRADVAIDHRKLAETLLAAGDGEGALDHASRANTLLTDLAGSSNDAYLKSNTGRAVLFVGHAQLLLGHAAAAVGCFRRAQQMADSLSQADPVNAVFRSDLARSESSLAAALARLRQVDEARDWYHRAMADWSKLRDSHTLSAEDASRADETALGLADISRPPVPSGHAKSAPFD
jgi:tetratricopeptide (TPR) repeat protein